MKFVIVSDRQKWGGMIVLHRIAELLNELGHDSKILYTGSGRLIGKKKLPRFAAVTLSSLIWIYYTCCDALKCWIVKKSFFKSMVNKHSELFYGYIYMPVKYNKRKWIPCVDANTIVIYPDMIYGNPLNAKKVVRFYMYYNRYPDDINATGVDDLCLCYREQFNDWNLNPQGTTMLVPYFDLNLYRKYNFGERRGVCYIIRKGKKRKDLPTKFDGIIVDDLPEEDKVRVFNECEKCISFDTETAYSSLAALCGCVSIIVPETGKSRYDYLTKGEVMYGVSFGESDEEIEYAKETLSLVKEYFEQLNYSGVDDVMRFIDLCEEYFNE